MKAFNRSKKQKHHVYTRAAHIKGSGEGMIATVSGSSIFISSKKVSFKMKEIRFGFSIFKNATLTVKYGNLKSMEWEGIALGI